MDGIHDMNGVRGGSPLNRLFGYGRFEFFFFFFFFTLPRYTVGSAFILFSYTLFHSINTTCVYILDFFISLQQIMHDSCHISRVAFVEIHTEPIEGTRDDERKDEGEQSS